ncbi:piggyBac transposable element-derived protein 4-like isoform X2 [Contarinia nasturtii]|nr:piggyBac transposable element-derived protein 4-like isoform X2 [Contarinia nasturtii]
MFQPMVNLRRLTQRQIADAMQANDDDESLDADFADEEESYIDDLTDSEEDHQSNFEEDSESESENEDMNVDDEEVEESTVFTGKDGTEWEHEPVQWARQQRNPNRSKLMTVTKVPGQHFDSPFDYFNAIFSQPVIDMIVRYTNIEGRKHKANFKDVDDIEIHAFIGLLFAAGVDRSSKRNYREFYGITRGMPLFRATLCLTRFMELLRFLRFDDKDTRSERRKQDKLAPIRDLFDMVVKNLGKMYSPGENVTIDEQLVPFRGRCSFKQYIPSKPDKYGLKIFWLVDAKNWYPLKAIPYLGRERSGAARQTNIAKNIVLNLCQPYYKTNRTVVFDNFFSNYDTQAELQTNGLYSVGTVRKNKKFVPPEFKPSNEREVGSNLFGFRRTCTLLSHIPRPKKSVIFLSTLHRTDRVEENGKAEINMFYNEFKGGVDVLDELCHTYTVQRKTNRWPMAYFMNLVNVAGVAAYAMWRTANNKLDDRVKEERKNFLTRLYIELTYQQIARRSTQGLTIGQRQSISDILGNNTTVVEPSTSRATKKNIRRRCHICPRSVDRKIKQMCEVCRKNVCKQHAYSIIKCKKCQKQPVINSSDSE